MLDLSEFNGLITLLRKFLFTLLKDPVLDLPLRLS